MAVTHSQPVLQWTEQDYFWLDVFARMLMQDAVVAGVQQREAEKKNSDVVVVNSAMDNSTSMSMSMPLLLTVDHKEERDGIHLGDQIQDPQHDTLHRIQGSPEYRQFQVGTYTEATSKLRSALINKQKEEKEEKEQKNLTSIKNAAVWGVIKQLYNARTPGIMMKPDASRPEACIAYEYVSARMMFGARHLFFSLNYITAQFREVMIPRDGSRKVGTCCAVMVGLARLVQLLVAGALLLPLRALTGVAYQDYKVSVNGRLVSDDDKRLSFSSQPKAHIVSLWPHFASAITSVLTHGYSIILALALFGVDHSASHLSFISTREQPSLFAVAAGVALLLQPFWGYLLHPAYSIRRDLFGEGNRLRNITIAATVISWIHFVIRPELARFIADYNRENEGIETTLLKLPFALNQQFGLLSLLRKDIFAYGITALMVPLAYYPLPSKLMVLSEARELLALACSLILSYAFNIRPDASFIQWEAPALALAGLAVLSCALILRKNITLQSKTGMAVMVLLAATVALGIYVQNRSLTQIDPTSLIGPDGINEAAAAAAQRLSDASVSHAIKGFEWILSLASPLFFFTACRWGYEDIPPCLYVPLLLAYAGLIISAGLGACSLPVLIIAGLGINMVTALIYTRFVRNDAMALQQSSPNYREYVEQLNHNPRTAQYLLLLSLAAALWVPQWIQSVILFKQDMIAQLLQSNVPYNSAVQQAQEIYQSDYALLSIFREDLVGSAAFFLMCAAVAAGYVLQQHLRADMLSSTTSTRSDAFSARSVAPSDSETDIELGSSVRGRSVYGSLNS